MPLQSSIEPWAESLIGWALEDAPYRIKHCPQMCRDGERLRPFWGAFIHRKGLTPVVLMPRVVGDGIELLVLYGPKRNFAQSMLMEPEWARGLVAMREWRKYCRAFVCVQFSTRSCRPDFIVMDTVAFAGTPRARAELLQTRYGRHIDWREWDELVGTDYARAARLFSKARDEMVANVITAATGHL